MPHSILLEPPPPIGWRENWEDHGEGKYDETWDGVVRMAPLPNNDHQDIQAGFVAALHELITRKRLGKVYPGVNVTDRHDDWRQNYRGPDVVVYLNGNSAINNGSHWIGGPDFLVEIISPTEDPLAKLEFYAKVNTREMLTVERDPWALELFRLTDGVLKSVGRATLENAFALHSETVDLDFALEADVERPRIRMTRGERVWQA